MSPKPTPGQLNDRYAYVPAGASQAISQQMHGLPAHLQKYASGSGGYVPAHAEAAITAHMQKNLPGHLKKYAGSYVQQNISSQGSARPGPTSRSLKAPPPMPDKLNRSHSGDIAADQYNAQFLNLFESDGPQTIQPGQLPATSPDQAYAYSSSADQSEYDFIMNSKQKPQRSFGPPTGTNARIALVAGGVVILIILGIVVSSILGKSGKDQTQRLLEISQRQTEIIRVATQADKKAKSSATKQFALTTRLSTESSQKDINEILNKRGYNEKKLTKVLSASKNTKTDSALEEAEKNSRFDETFMQILDGELSNYKKQLNGAAGAASKTQKKVLQKSFDDIETIQKKVEKSTPSTPATSDNEDIPAEE